MFVDSERALSTFECKCLFMPTSNLRDDTYAVCLRAIIPMNIVHHASLDCNYSILLKYLLLEAYFYYLRGPQGHIYIRYEHVRTHLNVETAELRQPVSEPAPSARMRASPVSPYKISLCNKFCCMCTCIVSLTAQVRLICSWCMKICL
jgi:hypothetical protein